MPHTDNMTKDARVGGRVAAGYTTIRLRVLDATVVAFVAATLVLMPVLAGGPDAAPRTSDTDPLSPQARETLADSRGDAAASAVLDRAVGNSEAEPASVRGVDGKPVDDVTRNALESASRGDAAARGSVTSDSGNDRGRSFR